MRVDDVTVGFDYGDSDENMKYYGHTEVPRLDMSGLKNLNVPISLFVGKHDILSTPKDGKIMKKLFGKAVHQYHEVNADHLSLLLGKDMTYFTDKAMTFLSHHAPPTTSSTLH